MLNQVMRAWPFLLGVAIGLHEAHRDIQLFREMSETNYWVWETVKLEARLADMRDTLDSSSRQIEAQAETITRMMNKLRPKEYVTEEEAKEGIITNG